MKLFSLVFLVTLLFLSTSCGKERKPVYDVPSKVQPFIDNFESEASTRNQELDIDDLVVEYMTDLMPDEVEAAGVCFFETDDAGPTIHLDTTTQNWQGSDFTKEELVFHELGHCILGRVHRNTLLSAGGYASIMKAEGSPSIASFCEWKREYYLDELFDLNAGEPEWVSDIPPFSTYTDEDKTTLFEDDFNDNSKAWNISSGEEIRKIENGIYSISSNSGSFIYERKNFSFNPDMDFEIEAEIKITEGQLFAGGLIWGGETITQPDEWYMAIDLDRNVSIGNFELQEYIRSPNFDIDLNEFNRYTIRKIGDKYYFYINGEAHNVIDYTSFDEKRYGFIVTPGSSMEIESFSVSFLNN